MSFLEPLLLLGGLAVGAPLWLHLRRRFDLTTIPFSTLRFFDARESRRLGALRLQDLLLLFLRLAAVALVVLAFAGPFLAGDALVSTSRVHLLDATLSRQADRDAFDADVAAILGAFEDRTPGSQDAVVVLGGEPQVVIPFRSGPEEARAALAGLEPTWERGSYLAAFRLAQSLLERSLGEERRLVVYADHQANQWHEGRQAAPFLQDVEVEWASRQTVESLPNLSVGAPLVRRWHAGDESILSLSAEVTRRGEAERARVLLTVDGESILDRALEFAPGVDRYVLFAEWPDEAPEATGGWIEGRVEISGEGDRLAADDRAYFSFSPARPQPIYLVARSSYLDLVLSPAVAQDRWRRVRLSPGDIDDEALPLARAIAVEASYLQSPRVRRIVERHLSEDRGVVLFIDRLTPGAVEALDTWGVRASPPREGRALEANAVGFVVPLHPLFRPFRDGDLGRLAEVEVTPTARLEAPTASGLMFARDGEPLLYEVRAGGRLLVFPFAFTRRQTNWPVLGSFVPFVDQLLQYAGGTEAGAAHYTPRDFFSLPVNEPTGPLEVVGDEGVVATLEAPAGGTLEARAPGAPGLYRLHEAESGALVSIVAVNPPAAESELEFVLEPSVAAWRRSTVEEAEVVAGVDRVVARETVQRWRGWLLAAACLFLVAEQTRLLFRGRTA